MSETEEDGGNQLRVHVVCESPCANLTYAVACGCARREALYVRVCTSMRLCGHTCLRVKVRACGGVQHVGLWRCAARGSVEVCNTWECGGVQHVGVWRCTRRTSFAVASASTSMEPELSTMITISLDDEIAALYHGLNGWGW